MMMEPKRGDLVRGIFMACGYSARMIEAPVLFLETYKANSFRKTGYFIVRTGMLSAGP
jgi:hypothetical protein